MLFILALPNLVTGFPEERLPTTMTVLVGALFGAATAGPPIAGAASHGDLWRWIFVGERRARSRLARARRADDPNAQAGRAVRAPR